MDTLGTSHRHPTDALSVDHLRTRTAERGRCTRLHDAVAAFDDLLEAARAHGVVDQPDVSRSLGAVVHAIATTITSRDVARDPARPAGPIGPVLLDRAAARFSARVVGTEIGRRPCPPAVLTALHAARHSLEASGALAADPTGPDRPSDRDTDTSSVVDVVVLGLVRDRSRIEPVLQALVRLRPSTVRLVGTPVPIRSDGARELIDLEYRRSSGPWTTRPSTPNVHLAAAHLTWIAQMLGEAGHHVVSTDVAAPSPDLADRERTVVVVGSGLAGSLRAVVLRRRILRAGGTAINARRNQPLGWRRGSVVAE